MDSALTLIAMGFAVFPLAARGKQPAIGKDHGGRGCLDATTATEQVRAWWTAFPQANIGIATGPISGCWVLDVDRDEAKGINGYMPLQVLNVKHGALPATRAVTTPRGGLHLYFAWDERQPVRCSTGKLALGLDTRGPGGYVVGPDSIVPNGEYVLADDSPIAPAPSWLIDALSEKPRQRVAARVVTIPAGEAARAADNLQRLSSSRADDYESWVEVGMSLYALGSDGLALWDNWSRSSSKYRDGECERKWGSFELSGRTLASLAYWANQDDPPKPKPAPSARRRYREDYANIIEHGL